ncbi:hypothetical protein [Leifsonia sp. NPDC058248]|uniref:hypothetical protein n=1 Tax=Leifsonia sp. NPDC058248 TaxID=3346402 RepID=UPI0036DEC1EE
MTKVDSLSSPASSDRPGGHRGRTIAIVIAAVVVAALVVTALVLAGARGAATNAGNQQPGGGPAVIPGASTTSPQPPAPTATPATGKATSKPKVDPRYGATVDQTVGKNVDAKLSGGMTAKIVSIEPVDAKAIRAGETAGSAIKVTIALTNTTGKDVSLSQVSVNSYYGSKSTPAVALSNGAKPLHGSLANGATASGVYLFSVPADQRAAAVVTMTDAAGAPVTVFK